MEMMRLAGHATIISLMMVTGLMAVRGQVPPKPQLARPLSVMGVLYSVFALLLLLWRVESEPGGTLLGYAAMTALAHVCLGLFVFAFGRHHAQVASPA